MKIAAIASGLISASLTGLASGARLSDRLANVHENFLENRREELPALSDPFGVPSAARIVMERSHDAMRDSLPWKRNIVSTVFWVGELPTENNPTPNTCSAWDQNWQQNFGGYDHPERRNGYRPEGFTPALNPFYIALPYNDVAKGGVHRPEASQVIPWFWENYRGDGISVCKGRWVAIHHEGRVCYAQWEDVGPFEVDHWQYVFGKEAPRGNRNQSAGIDLSPATRDYLGLTSGAKVEWRFVQDRQVPQGPWRDWRNGLALPKR
ncbi:MAG: hypothetical protein H8M99_07755 [Gloeobacteraceae cyanobacterium ES-bin-144]|nr:hypothetical protein [Verrucomicrobiales bacterium]